jgi:hypothetical protein
MSLSRLAPASPVLRSDAFDHAAYVYELKMDGFRAIAHVDRDSTRLVSRRGNVYRSFPRLCGAIAKAVTCEAVLDGESFAWTPKDGHSFTIYSGDVATQCCTFSICFARRPGSPRTTTGTSSCQFGLYGAYGLWLNVSLRIPVWLSTNDVKVSK